MKYQQEHLQLGLKDLSPYVRKTAVMGVLKLFYTEPHTVDSEYDSSVVQCTILKPLHISGFCGWQGISSC